MEEGSAIKNYVRVGIALVLALAILNGSCACLPRPIKEFREYRGKKREDRQRDRRQWREQDEWSSRFFRRRRDFPFRLPDSRII